MEFSNDFFCFFFPVWSLVLAGFLLSCFITWNAIPSIVTVSKMKGLSKIPNGRSSHKNNTPLLGGVAVFAGFILSTVIIAGVGLVHELKYIISGLIILFFIGVKDDILVIDSKKKLAGEIMASLLIIILGDIRIGNFHGFQGIDQVSYIVSVIFTLFVFIVIINGFNLIDGIDGLASGVGIVTSITFGIWFWISGHIPYVIFSFSLAGSLIAFFYFNVFSKKNKIFLGDTGSLIIGMVMAIIVVRFLKFEVGATGLANTPATTAVAIGILIIPLYDTIRVFTIRLAKGTSPFKADRLHVHHRLLELGLTHLQSTSIILVANLLFIVLSLLLKHIGNMTLFFIIFTLAALLSYLPVFLVNRRTRESKIEIEIATVNIEHALLNKKQVTESIESLPWNKN